MDPLYKRYSVLVLITLGALFIVRELNLAYPVFITTTQRSLELSVTGEGKVEVTPDTAFIRVGVAAANAKTVNSVQEELAMKSDALIDAMVTLGINKADMKTTTYNIYPLYGDTVRTGPSSITGYSGSTIVQIKTKNIDRVGSIVAKATEVGANQIEGVEFTIDDPASYRSKARKAAIADAKKQAQALSKDLGIRLGNITNIVESAGLGGGPVPYIAEVKDSALGGAAPAIQPGTQTVMSTVTVYFQKR